MGSFSTHNQRVLRMMVWIARDRSAATPFALKLAFHLLGMSGDSLNDVRPTRGKGFANAGAL